jgi:hypothetical protein
MYLSSAGKFAFIIAAIGSLTIGLFIQESLATPIASNMTSTEAGNMTDSPGNITDSNVTEAAANETGNISAIKKPGSKPGDPCCVTK